MFLNFLKVDLLGGKWEKMSKPQAKRELEKRLADAKWKGTREDVAIITQQLQDLRKVTIDRGEPVTLEDIGVEGLSPAVMGGFFPLDF